MRTIPWTVNVENLADHAVPLGHWINRMLWRWSPWHLAHMVAKEASEADHWRQSYSAATRDVRHLRQYIRDTDREPTFLRVLQSAPVEVGTHIDMASSIRTFRLEAESCYLRVDFRAAYRWAKCPEALLAGVKEPLLLACAELFSRRIDELIAQARREHA